jgi:hypothetical protein
VGEYERVRFVVDEASLDCDDLRDEAVRESLGRLMELLSAIREVEPEPVGILSGWGAFMCWRGLDLASVLNSAEVLRRDEGLLLLGLLSKCASIDDDAEDLDPEVSVDGGLRVTSYGIALVHAGMSAAACRGRAVISLSHLGRSEMHTVTRNDQTVDVLFVVDFADERLLWRAIYDLEDVSEAAFFAIAKRAFPELLFAPTLSFRRFQGGYAVRAVVVRHLGALNDNWTAAYAAEAGKAEAISTLMGVDVSRESANTRASEELMRHRDVEFADTVYRCEWHSKLEPHRNRVHFHPASESLAGPLIGIFCDHLPTKG